MALSPLLLCARCEEILWPHGDHLCPDIAPPPTAFGEPATGTDRANMTETMPHCPVCLNDSLYAYGLWRPGDSIVGRELYCMTCRRITTKAGA